MHMSQENTLNVNKGFQMLIRNQGTLNNLTTSSQQDMYILSKELYEISLGISKKFLRMNQKSDELITLEKTLIGLQVASTLVGGNQYSYY